MTHITNHSVKRQFDCSDRITWLLKWYNYENY